MCVAPYGIFACGIRISGLWKSGTQLKEFGRQVALTRNPSQVPYIGRSGPCEDNKRRSASINKKGHYVFCLFHHPFFVMMIYLFRKLLLKMELFLKLIC